MLMLFNKYKNRKQKIKKNKLSKVKLAKIIINKKHKKKLKINQQIIKINKTHK